ncbi:MAG: hypothetical protein ACXADL_09420 [Candidatus Thorarchaeota archaeon]
MERVKKLEGLKCRTLSIVAFGVILMLFVGLNGVVDVYAANGWSDDFDDGNYDDWNVVYGQFDASSNVLRAEASGINVIYHNSTCAYGVWLFDLWENSTAQIDQHVFFISLDWTLNDTTGYSVSLEYGATSTLTLYRWDNDVSTVLARTDLPDDPPGWYSYNVTRTQDGHFDVLRDGTPELFADDNTITTSDYFVYDSNEGGAIDNIVVVCGGPGTTPTTDGQPDCIIYIIVIIIVFMCGIIIICIWVYRRRS